MLINKSHIRPVGDRTYWFRHGEDATSTKLMDAINGTYEKLSKPLGVVVVAIGLAMIGIVSMLRIQRGTSFGWPAVAITILALFIMIGLGVRLLLVKSRHQDILSDLEYGWRWRQWARPVDDAVSDAIMAPGVLLRIKTGDLTDKALALLDNYWEEASALERQFAALRDREWAFFTEVSKIEATYTYRHDLDVLAERYGAGLSEELGVDLGTFFKDRHEHLKLVRHDQLVALQHQHDEERSRLDHLMGQHAPSTKLRAIE